MGRRIRSHANHSAVGAHASSFAAVPRSVIRLFCIAIVARTPFAAISLLLIVRTKELTGSYAASGLVVGAMSVALAICAPCIGRVVDRHGQPRVLHAPVAITTSALAAFRLLP